MSTEGDDNVHAELAAAKRQVAELTGATKKGKKSKKAPLSSLIRGAIKSEVWRDAKFISGEAQLEKVCKLVLSNLAFPNLKLDSQEPEEVTKVEQWIAEHSKTVSSELNGHRSYVVGRIKDACWAYMKQHGREELPTVDMIEDVLARNKDVDPGTMMWWWDKILPMAAGNKIHWSTKTKYFHTITGSFVGGNPDSGREIPCSTEAFAAIAFMCNRAKWMKMFELRKPGMKFNIVKNASKVKNKNPKILNLFYEEHPELVPNWTDSNVGQAIFGGWSQEGLRKFVGIRKALKIARGTKHSVALEKKALVALRKENGITAKTIEEHRKSLGYGKKTASVASLPEVEDVFAASDDSD